MSENCSSSNYDQSELPQAIIENERAIEKLESRDALCQLYDEYIKTTDVKQKMDFLDDLSNGDKVALREIFIKQYLGVHARLLSNIQLITENIYNS